MSSFKELSELSIEQLNSVDYFQDYSPIILPAIITRGKATQHNYDININTEMRVIAEADQITNPTTATYNNNDSSVYRTKVASFDYYGFTKYYLITENAASYDQASFDSANKLARGALNKTFDEDSYKGTELNKGLISDVDAPFIDNYNTGDLYFEKLMVAKNKFMNDNDLMASEPVYMMVSGTMFNDLSLICLNGTKLVSQALAENNIVVILTPNYVSTQNRVDFVDFKGLHAIYGKLPQAISTVEIIRDKGSINKFAELFIGYQSVAIHKLKSTAVQSYLKA